MRGQEAVVLGFEVREENVDVHWKSERESELRDINKVRLPDSTKGPARNLVR